MYDMNFFSVYKKRRAKSKGLKIFLAVFIVLLLLVNAGIIGGGLWLFNNMEEEIQEKEDWINDPATKEAIAEAARVREEASLVKEYHTLIKDAEQTIEKMKQIDSGLFDDIRGITPVGVSFHNMQISGRYINLTCTAVSMNDVLDMYHAFIEDVQFVNVSISSVSISEDNSEASFNLSFAVKEEDNETN